MSLSCTTWAYRLSHSCITYTPVCTVAQDTCVVHATINEINAHTPKQVRPCDGKATSLQWKIMRPILQLEFCPRNSKNPRHPMAQSQLRCHTGIMWSSAMMWVPSSLSMLCTRSLAMQPIHHKIPLFFKGQSGQKWPFPGSVLGDTF